MLRHAAARLGAAVRLSVRLSVCHKLVPRSQNHAIVTDDAHSEGKELSYFDANFHITGPRETPGEGFKRDWVGKAATKRLIG